MKNFYNIMKQHNPVSDDQIFNALGNHDVRGSGGWNDPSGADNPKYEIPYWDTIYQLYMEYNADYMPETDGKVYFEREIAGYKFIVLNTERALKDWAYISDEQVQWLEDTLEKTANDGKPVFITLHQPLEGTVWRSDAWSAGDACDALKEVLNKYPQAVFMSGHIHNGLGVTEAVDRTYGTMVDIPSYNLSENGHRASGIGFYVKVYDDLVVYKARNFKTGTWLPEYDITIDWPSLSVVYKEANDVDEDLFSPESLQPVYEGREKAEEYFARTYEPVSWSVTRAPEEALFSRETRKEIGQVSRALAEALQELSEREKVYEDGIYDEWIQDSSTVKGGEKLELTEDGYLYMASGSSNGNNPGANPPAVFMNNSYEVQDTGFFEADIKIPDTVTSNRAGIYLNYADPGNALLIGYDAGGWFWQRYGEASDPYYTGSRIPKPENGSTVKIRLEWEDNKLTLATLDGTDMFPGLPMDLSGITNGGNRIAVKAGSYSADITELLLKNVHYDGQKEIEVYTVKGTVNDGAVPLKDVIVKIAGGAFATTNANGNFTLLGVPAGTHTVTFEKEGYKTESLEIQVIDGNLEMTPVTMQEAEVETETLESLTMAVRVDKEFPRVLDYTIKDGEKIFYGQSAELDSIRINGTDVKTELVSSEVSGTRIEYVLKAASVPANINAIITAEFVVEGNTLAFNITDIQNNLNNDTYPVQTIEIPNHSLISVRSTQEGANLMGAAMSGNTTRSGDEYLEINSSASNATKRYMYAFISNDELSAGIWSNSEYGNSGAAIDNNRITAVITERNSYKTAGLSSSAWYYNRKVTAKGQAYVLEETEMPSTKIIITNDQNDDGLIDWQDGAIAFRTIMNNPYKSEEVPELVAYRIAMNFGGQAQNPFLMTLDNVKKVSLHTDGLGQSVLLKGYGSEGHDSGHPDYGDIGTRIGGADDMNTLMTEGLKYGARFGIHINASEMYPEAKAFSDNLVRRNADGSLRYGWNWLDQGVGIDGLYDLASGEREDRFDELKEQVGDNLDFIYLDVWGNNTSGAEDAWETRKISRQIINRGWRMSNEWGYANEYDSTFQHWAADLTYGGYTLKGINSAVMRFLRNHQKDSWVADYPKYAGAAVAPLLGGYNMKDFEGWQGRNDYEAYMTNLFTHDLSTKFLQHYRVMKWTDGEPVRMTNPDGGSFNWTPEMEIVLQDEQKANTIVITRGSNDYSDLANYRSRTMTLNGKVILKGELAAGDNSRKGDETYLIPWYWDAETGEKFAAEDEKLYHWNTLGGTTTWELPAGWEGLTSVVVYQLTDLGKIAETVVPVQGGTVTLEADAETPYVVYKGQASDEEDLQWSIGMHVEDSGFNSGNLDNWTKQGSGTADIARSQYSNQMLKLDGEVSVTQKLTDLIPGEKYAAYVGVDNRSEAKAWVTIDAGAEQLASNYTELSIARNYVQADAHNTNSATVDGSSYFQNMYVFFTAPEDGSDVTITLKKEAGADSAYFDNIRVVETKADNILSIDEDGYVTDFKQDFEHNAQGIYPFVIGNAEGVQDNRTHLSQLHEPFTQAGWDVKKMNDVLDGEWSLKTNGLTQKSRMVYQTIPQNIRFKAGVTYNISFDYELGSDRIYAVVTGNGEFVSNPVLQYMPMALGETNTYTFTIIGDDSEQNWFGIYSTSTSPDLQGTSSKASDFGGYKDFVMDNLVIRVSDVQKAGLFDVIAQAEKLYEVDYTSASWAPFVLALAEARTVLANQEADQMAVDASTQDLTEKMNNLSALLTSVNGTVTGPEGPVENAMITLIHADFDAMSTVTDENGQYAFEDIFVRTYAAKVQADGYGTLYNQSVVTEANANVKRDFALEYKVQPGYENSFANGDISMMRNLEGNTREVTGKAAVYDGSDALLAAFPGGGRANYVDAAAPQFVNGVFEADITPVTSGVRFGLVLRADNMDQRLYVGVGDTESSWFWEYWGGTDGNKYSGMSSGPALTAGITRHIKVELKDDTRVTLWVDGQQIFTVTLNNAPKDPGFIGFECRNSNQYYIQNIEVTSYDEPVGEEYTIAVDDSIDNGEIKASAESAYESDKITVTAIPAEGYRLALGSLKYNDTVIEADGSGTYTFNMPAENVIITGAFEKTANKVRLGYTINKALELKEDYPENLIESIRIKFEAALERAIEVYNDPYAEKDQIDEAREALILAIHHLSFTADFEGLQKAYDDAVELIDSGLYEDDKAMKDYKEIVEEIKEMLNNKDLYTDTEITDILERLAEAEGKLIKKSDSIDLSELLDEIDISEKLNLSLYLDKGKTEFNEALAYAKAVAENPQSQDQVDNATERLLDARINLRLIPNKDALEQLLGKAKSFKAEDYTQESFAALMDAVVFAQAIFDNPQADQEAVDEAERVLAAAIGELEPINTDDTDDTDDSHDTSDTDDTNDTNDTNDTKDTSGTDQTNDTDGKKGNQSDSGTGKDGKDNSGGKSKVKTGDYTPIVLLVVMLSISALYMVYVADRRRRNK